VSPSTAIYIDRDYVYFGYFLKLLYSFSKSSDIENLNNAMLKKSSDESQKITAGLRDSYVVIPSH
jgi:hypothetical protein